MLPSTVTILFAGKPLNCRRGSSVAVALWEHGIRVLSHSPKYGRPRGLHCARGQCTDCLMRIDGQPNVRACLTEVRDGLRVERQGSGAWYGRLLRWVVASSEGLLPSGFYFKWFTRPAWLSRLFLKGIRPLTGFGKLPEPGSWYSPSASHQAASGRAEADLGRFDRVVVGGGSSGLLAATRAVGQSAGRVLLVDDFPEPGGHRWRALAELATAFGPEMCGLTVLARAWRQLQAARHGFLAHPDLDTAWSNRVVAAYPPDQLLLRNAEGLATVRAGSVAWHAGALDRIGLFASNDLPGIWGPRALYRLLCHDRLQVAERDVIVCGGGLDLWLAAALLQVRGARVQLVLTAGGWQDELEAALAMPWPLHAGLELTAARAGRSGNPIGRFSRSPLALEFSANAGTAPPLILTADLAIVARRGKPVYDIPYQLGADLVLRPEYGGYLPAAADPAAAADHHTVLPGGIELWVGGEALGQSAAACLAPSSEEAPS
ncbi:MAG: 2Fe-2S iron-sulfur cluster-binding protein [bacterium]